MTSEEKLQKLVEYIYDAERCREEQARNRDFGTALTAIQDITLFIEHELIDEPYGSCGNCKHYSRCNICSYCNEGSEYEFDIKSVCN